MSASRPQLGSTLLPFTRRAAGALSLAALLLSLGNGCWMSRATDTAEDGASEQAVTTTRHACSLFARTLCGQLESCAGGHFFPRYYLDGAHCEASLEARCALDRTADDVHADALALAACRADLRDASCGDVLLKKLPTSCTPPGARDDGSPCGTDLQCQSGFCAKRTACGVCAPKPMAGEPCINGRCAPGFACGFFANRCIPLGDVGAACDESSTGCRMGLDCIEGRCTPGMPEGSPCSAGASSYEPTCDVTQGLMCSGFGPMARCVRPRVVTTGETCGLNDVMTDGGLLFEATVCRADAACERANPGGPSTRCTTRGREGEPCPENVDDPCENDLACRDGVCVHDNPADCR